MNCQKIQAAIDAASPREPFGEPVRRHLTDCDGCRRYADELGNLVTLLNAQPRVVAPADFDFRLRARLAAARSKPRGPFSFLEDFWALPFSFGRTASAMAAVAMVAVLGTLYFTQRKATETPILVANTIPPREAKAADTPPVPPQPSNSALAEVKPPRVTVPPRHINDSRRGGSLRPASFLLDGPGDRPRSEIATRAVTIIKNTRSGRERSLDEVMYGAQPVVSSAVAASAASTPVMTPVVF